MLIIIAVVVGLLIFVSAGFVTISTGQIENFRDENGNVIENLYPVHSVFHNTPAQVPMDSYKHTHH